MDRVSQRLKSAERALATFEELAATFVGVVQRDAAIQRFEYTFEATWKAAEEFLRGHEGLALASPKAVIRACHEVGVLGPDEGLRALEMADDRNLTSHTYHEPVAVAIGQRLAGHAALLRVWLEAMRRRVAA